MRLRQSEARRRRRTAGVLCLLVGLAWAATAGASQDATRRPPWHIFTASVSQTNSMRITATLPYGPVGSTTCTVEATFTSGTSKRFFIGTHGLRRTYVGFREPVRISTRKKDFAYRVRRFRSPPIAGASQLVIGLTRCDPEDPQRSSICSGTYRAAGTFRFLWGALSDLPGELSWQLNTPRAPEPRPPASCLESDWGRIVVENAFEPFLEGGAVTVLRKRLLRDRRFMATREEQLESSSTVSVIRNQAMLIPASR